MRTVVFRFLLVVALELAVAPVANLTKRVPADGESRWTTAFLYNTDFLAGPVNSVLVRFGISRRPDDVVIGYDGFLFLGDRWESSISTVRDGSTSSDRAIAARIADAQESWDRWFERHGVDAYRILVVPDKSTAYEDRLPHWVRRRSPTPTDALLERADRDLVIDLRPEVASLRRRSDVILYSRTDSHWNVFGASSVVAPLRRSLSAEGIDLRWPNDQAFDVTRVDRARGGDLTRMLGIADSSTELVPQIRLAESGGTSVVIDYDSGRELERASFPFVDPTPAPIRIVTPDALNQAKVVWISDSFGKSMSPILARIFSEIVVVHWSPAADRGSRVVELVEDVDPDYVILSIVERLARSDIFASSPPLFAAPTDTSELPIHLVRGARSSDLVADDGSNRYVVSGQDPWVEFRLPSPMVASEVDRLAITIRCDNGTPRIPLQLHWRSTSDESFDEARSSRFVVTAGSSLVHLDTHADFRTNTRIDRIRLDFDTESQCRSFELQQPTLGAAACDVASAP